MCGGGGGEGSIGSPQAARPKPDWVLAQHGMTRHDLGLTLKRLGPARYSPHIRHGPCRHGQILTPNHISLPAAVQLYLQKLLSSFLSLPYHVTFFFFCIFHIHVLRFLGHAHDTVGLLGNFKCYRLIMSFFLFYLFGRSRGSQHLPSGSVVMGTDLAQRPESLCRHNHFKLAQMNHFGGIN